MNCDSKRPSSGSGETPPPDYILDPVPSRGAPETLAELSAWLAKHSPSGNWFGKLYVASTIRWDDESDVFRQSGCSPNYKARLWTLACCKHDMRRSAKLKQALEKDDPSVFVFTLAEKSSIRSSDAQALVSVAKVTKYFFEMSGYASFLLQSRDHDLISSRLSREPMTDGGYGWHFGDCHADRNGHVGSPQLGHVHRRDKNDDQWKADTNEDRKEPHAILVSEHFLVWDRPMFASVEMIKQARYGRNVTELQKVLRVIRG